MRFGVSGQLFPHHVDEFTEEMARTTREMGFTGIFTRFDHDDPFATTPAQCHRVRQILRDHGVDMVMAIGHRPPLMHPDEGVRRVAVQTLRAAIKVAAELGSMGCHTGPGSMAQVSTAGEEPGLWGGAWNPHPQNWSAICRKQLIKSLKEAASAAEDSGVTVGMEGHVLVTLDSAEIMRAVLDEVDSQAIKCDLDPVNWLRLETVYESGAAIGHMADVLGPRVFNAHAKDVVVQNRLVTHIDECSSGQGILDYDVFMRRMEALGPARYLVIEHASMAEIPAAKRFLDHKAAELGIGVF